MLPKGNAGTFDVFSFSWYDCRKGQLANATSDGQFFMLKDEENILGDYIIFKVIFRRPTDSFFIFNRAHSDIR